MIFRIHFIWPDGTPDHILVKADTIDEIRVIVKKEMIIQERHLQPFGGAMSVHTCHKCRTCDKVIVEMDFRSDKPELERDCDKCEKCGAYTMRGEVDWGEKE